MKTLLKSLAILIAATGLACAAEKAAKLPKLEWMTDFAAAKEKAKAENKQVLMNFTGSDWCPWCIKLDKEVLSSPEFNAYAEKNLVLVIVDFPNEKRIKSSVEKQNKALKETYNVGGFPTVLVVDDEGKKVGQTGYIEGGPAKWVANLEKVAPPKK